MKQCFRRCCCVTAAACLVSIVTQCAWADVFPNPSIPQHSRSGSHRSNGLKRAVYLVVHDENIPISPSAWTSKVNSVRSREAGTRDFFAENSGGKFDIYYDQILDIAIPFNADGTRPGSSSNRGPFNTLVENYAEATYGIDMDDYYMTAFDVTSSSPWPDQGWGGLSAGDRIYLQSTSQGLINHEIGHQVGLGHATALVTRNNSDFHAYTFDRVQGEYLDYPNGSSPFDAVPFGVANDEYGNPFDTMGSSSSQGDFHIRGKVELGWIPSSQVETVDQAGTYRIYAHDELQAVTNGGGDYGVADGYDPSVDYGLTYTRLGQKYNVSNNTFSSDSQRIDIEYRSGADGAYFYLHADGTDGGSGDDVILMDLDPQTSHTERLLEVGRSIEDTTLGMSTFIVDSGSIGQSNPDYDFLAFNPPDPTLLAGSWWNISAVDTGVDSIGSWIELAFEAVSPLNGIDGDLNQDTLVNETDLNLFIAGWRTDTTNMSSVDKYLHGDMNFNGITDLEDAYLMREALIAAGASVGTFDALQIPEPSSVWLVTLGAVLLGGAGYRRRR